MIRSPIALRVLAAALSATLLWWVAGPIAAGLVALVLMLANLAVLRHRAIR